MFNSSKAVLSCLFITALWSPVGKGLTSWLLLVMLIFLLLSGKMWYLIVSIPDLCRLSYIVTIIAYIQLFRKNV